MRWLYGPCSHSQVGFDLALNTSYQNGSMFSKLEIKAQVRSSSNKRNGRMAPANRVSLDCTWHKILVMKIDQCSQKEFTAHEVE